MFNRRKYLILFLSIFFIVKSSLIASEELYSVYTKLSDEERIVGSFLSSMAYGNSRLNSLVCNFVDDKDFHLKKFNKDNHPEFCQKIDEMFGIYFETLKIDDKKLNFETAQKTLYEILGKKIYLWAMLSNNYAVVDCFDEVKKLLKISSFSIASDSSTPDLVRRTDKEKNNNENIPGEAFKILKRKIDGFGYRDCKEILFERDFSHLLMGAVQSQRIIRLQDSKKEVNYNELFIKNTEDVSSKIKEIQDRMQAILIHFNMFYMISDIYLACKEKEPNAPYEIIKKTVLHKLSSFTRDGIKSFINEGNCSLDDKFNRIGKFVKSIPKSISTKDILDYKYLLALLRDTVFLNKELNLLLNKPDNENDPINKYVNSLLEQKGGFFGSQEPKITNTSNKDNDIRGANDLLDKNLFQSSYEAILRRSLSDIMYKLFILRKDNFIDNGFCKILEDDKQMDPYNFSVEGVYDLKNIDIAFLADNRREELKKHLPKLDFKSGLLVGKNGSGKTSELIKRVLFTEFYQELGIVPALSKDNSNVIHVPKNLVSFIISGKPSEYKGSMLQRSCSKILFYRSMNNILRNIGYNGWIYLDESISDSTNESTFCNIAKKILGKGILWVSHCEENDLKTLIDFKKNPNIFLFRACFKKKIENYKLMSLCDQEDSEYIKEDSNVFDEKKFDLLDGNIKEAFSSL